MEQEQTAPECTYCVPSLPQKIRLYIAALVAVPFYRYGEIGNICYTIGKNLLDGVILYTMFSMAEEELKVAAILGVLVKYAYPAITMVSSTYTSGFVDRLEALKQTKGQLRLLIFAHVGIAASQSLGALCLLLCFPPVFRYVFYGLPVTPYILVAIYLMHHIFDGSGQIIEGRTWFKIVEIKIRRGEDLVLAQNFWVIYTLAQNFQLLLGQVFIWAALGVTTAFSQNLTAVPMTFIVCSGFLLVVCSKFILPAAYKLRVCS